jgi:hexosaminidase
MLCSSSRFSKRIVIVALLAVALMIVPSHAQAPAANAAVPTAEAQSPTPTTLPILQPTPREAKFSTPVSLGNGVSIEVVGEDAEDLFAAQDLREGLHAAHVATPSTAPFTIHLLRSSSDEGKLFVETQKLALTPEMHDEGYALVVDTSGATIVADTAAGIFYGVQTLKQLLPLADATPQIMQTVIRDWPAMKYRGVDDDLSRGPFPTLAFMKHQIRVLASFKANIYSPYFEHTLAYTENPIAAQPGGSLTPAEAAELVHYATKYHIIVVPEQESFGHLHHVLKYDLYRDLAETPHGHVLAPGQAGTLPLIHSWFEQIAKEFPGPFVHIGADETFELGMGQTREAVQKDGLGPTYVEFLNRIHDSLAPLNKRLLFWGDIGGSDPDAVAKLPKDMIAVPWNYGNFTGFDKMIEPFKNQGIETWVAPGASNWSQVYPDNNVAFGNIQGFIRDGQRLGSTGSLVTVWNDDGEGLFQQDWYGVLFGAVAAWQPGESSIPQWQAAYGQLFHGDSSGRIDKAEKELMAIYELLKEGKIKHNTDSLFWSDPFTPRGREIQLKLQPIAYQMRIHAETAIVLLAQARAANPGLLEQQALEALDLGARRFDLIGQKAEYAEETARLYDEVRATQHDKALEEENRNKFSSISSTNGKMQDLRDEYSAIREEYRQIWLSENTNYWLENVMVRYDIAIETWQKRGEQFSELQHQLKTVDLPAPETLGLPAVEVPKTEAPQTPVK